MRYFKVMKKRTRNYTRFLEDEFLVRAHYNNFPQIYPRSEWTRREILDVAMRGGDPATLRQLAESRDIVTDDMMHFLLNQQVNQETLAQEQRDERANENSTFGGMRRGFLAKKENRKSIL